MLREERDEEAESPAPVPEIARSGAGWRAYLGTILVVGICTAIAWPMHRTFDLFYIEVRRDFLHKTPLLIAGCTIVCEECWRHSTK